MLQIAQSLINAYTFYIRIGYSVKGRPGAESCHCFFISHIEWLYDTEGNMLQQAQHT